MTTPITDQVAVLEAGMAQQVPAEILAPFVQERQQLAASGVPAGAARPGTVLPDAELLDAHGKPTTLRDALAGQPAVLVFYRGAWCPFCNLTLRTYQTELTQPLAERGAVLVAISPQKPDGSLTMQETNELTYSVLSDPAHILAGHLGILTEPTEGAKASQAALGLDVAATNADGTSRIPMPTTVIVDASGAIRWIDVHPDYATRSEPAEILAAYDAAV